MSWLLVGTAAVGLVTSGVNAKNQGDAADDAANASRRATDASLAENRRQFDITQQNLRPWLDSGTWALGQQRRFLEGDYSGALNSPDYLAALESGTQQLDAGATAGGNLWGGGADADRIRFGQNLATQQIGNYWNKLAGLSNTGQSTANTLGAYGQNYANQFGNAMNNNAQAQGQSAYNKANAWSNFGNQLAQTGGWLAGQYGNGWGGV